MPSLRHPRRSPRPRRRLRSSTRSIDRDRYDIVVNDSTDSLRILDEHGRISRSIPCLGCEYNLRGLEPEGRCPECGTPVGRTVFRSRLHFSDPRWLGRLQSGCTWLTIAIILTLCSPNTFDPDEVTPGALLWVAIAVAMMFVGAWRLTSPEPGIAPKAGNAERTIVIRAVTACAAALHAFPTGIVFADAVPLVSLMFGISALLFAATGWMLAVHLAEYARRIPDDRIRNVTILTKWILATSVGGFGLIGLIAPWFGTTAQRTSGMLVGPYTLSQPFFRFIGLPLAIASLIWLVLAVVTLLDYRGAFKRAAGFASEQPSSDSTTG